MRLQYHSDLQITGMQNVVHGGLDADSIPLVYDAVLIGKYFPTIRMRLLPPLLEVLELGV